MDLSGLKYNIKAKDIFKEYPELNGFKEWESELKEFKLELNNVMKFIILMYDPKSPLIESGPYEGIKIHALKEAAIKTDVFSKALIDLRCPPANKMISLWFQRLDNAKFELYITLLESYSQLLEVIREPISLDLDDDKRLKAFESKGKIKKQAILDEVDISTIRKQLFENHDEVASVVKENVENIRKTRKSMEGDVEKRIMGMNERSKQTVSEQE